MSEAKAPTGTRYRAFISYSHKDASFASRLHRRLEGYVLPKRLGVGRRLTPIFKDREELPAAHDLSAQVRAALAASDCLIVVCSPDAAASQWVGREIETFRALHPHRPILAALVRGEPAGSFPDALITGSDPLAADFRKAADGDQLALLKLVAGIAGIGVDELVQRDAQRRLRGVMAVTAVSTAAMLIMFGMTAFALKAQSAAQKQRAEAEGLVEFMITDLRDHLEGIGSLGVLAIVNRRALDYYGDDLASLSDDSVRRRTLILLAVGEDEITKGDLSAANKAFREARTQTARLLSKAPNDPERIWAHAQSEFWTGYSAYLEKDAVKARASFEAYRRYAGLLVQVDPANKKYRAELAYADGNICTLTIQLEPEVDRALSACRSALSNMLLVTGPEPATSAAGLDLANRYAWLSQAFELAGDDNAARREALKLEALLDELMAKYPSNVKLIDQWTSAQRSIARLDYRRGQFSTALRRAEACRDGLIQLSRLEPKNMRWREQLAIAEASIKAIKRAGPKDRQQ